HPPWSPTAVMLAVVGIPSREPRPPGSGEDTLSPELRTAGLLRPHVWVGYQWSHTGFRLGRKASRNRSIRSLVSQSPQNRTCTFQRLRLKHRTTPLRGTIGRGSTGPRHPLRSAVSPLALGSTWTVLRQSRRPKIGGGRTTGVAARVRSASPPLPVGCRF